MLLFSKNMKNNLPDFQQLTGNQSARLRGIKSWDDFAIIGKNNLERIVGLAQENVYRLMSAAENNSEIKPVKKGIDYIKNDLLPASENKPTLPRLRNELFSLDNSVYVYLGDTENTSVEKGWVKGKVSEIAKGFNKNWKDGTPNSGYFWKVTVRFDQNIFPDENKISFSTSEPRAILEWEYDFLRDENNRDFLRIFSDNAYRDWKPLWCIERNSDCKSAGMNFKNWIDKGRIIN